MNNAYSMPNQNQTTINLPTQIPLSADAFSTAVDNDSMVFTHSSYAWAVYTGDSYSGSSCVKSYAIGDSQETYFTTTVTGTGTISFYWKVSSESNYDYLRFYVDSVEVTGVEGISGTVSWTQETYTITTSGSHTLRWRFNRDGSGSAGSNAGYVDYIRWTVGSSGSSNSITVTNPSSSSTYDNGDSMSIQWVQSSTISNVRIELYDGTTLENTIASSTTDDGSYTYTIPSSLSYSSSYRIKITDIANSNTYGYSSYFTIGSSGPDLSVIIGVVVFVGFIGIVFFVAIIKGAQKKAKDAAMTASDRKPGMNKSFSNTAASSSQSKPLSFKQQVIVDTFLKMK